MTTLHAETTIQAPITTVWPPLAAVCDWAGWMPTVTQVQPLSGRELAQGARYVVHQPRLRPATWTVVDLQPMCGFTWQARSPGLVMTASHTLSPVSGDGTRLRLSFSFQGPLGVLLAPLFRRLTARYLALEAAALKQRCETPA